MNADERKAIDRRLARIEGQVRGLRRLIEEDAYCCDILNQVAAAKSALGQVASSLASQHIKNCILGHDETSSHTIAKAMSRDELLDELDEVLARISKP